MSYLRVDRMRVDGLTRSALPLSRQKCETLTNVQAENQEIREAMDRFKKTYNQKVRFSESNWLARVASNANVGACVRALVLHSWL